jgi:hypothetical protein
LPGTHFDQASLIPRVVPGIFALLLATAALQAPASAAPFLGVVADGPLADGEVDFKQQASLMTREGVQSVRTAFYWIQAQPFGPGSQIPQGFEDINGVPTSFDATDRVVAACAKNRLEVLPVVVEAPMWARVDPTREWSPPVDPSAYADYVAALARRYGSTGSFWASHPDLPRAPIRFWQIWNEPAGGDRPNDPSIFWDDTAPFQDRYVSMLSATRKALMSVDRRAKTVLGGLFGRSWASLQSLYDHDARGLFDVVAIHPYARTPTGSLRVARLVRRVMQQHGDGAVPLFVSELSWPSSDGKVSTSYPITTTEQGQAKRLFRAFHLLGEARRQLRLRRAYWYTWIARDASASSAFDYSGLLHLKPSGAITAKPAFAAFRRVARWLARAGPAGHVASLSRRPAALAPPRPLRGIL